MVRGGTRKTVNMEGTTAMANERDRLRVLRGPRRSAALIPGGRLWYVLPDAVDARDLGIGACLTLARAPAELREDPQTSRVSVRVPLPSPRLPVAAAGLFAGLLFALALAPRARALSPGFRPLDALAELSDLAPWGLGIVAGFALSRLWEAAVLRNAVRSPVSFFGIGWGGPACEPVAWRLGIPAMLAVLAMLGPLALSSAAWSWSVTGGAAVGGIALGAWIAVLQAAFLLRPGPASCLIEVATGLQDVPARLHWMLTSSLLPAARAAQASGGRLAAPGGLALALWLLLVSSSWSRITAAPRVGWTAAAHAGFALLTCAALAFAGWLTYSAVRLVSSAVALRSGGTMAPLVPGAAELTRWREDSPLLRHVPELADRSWRWFFAPPGSVLASTAAGDPDSFCWLVSGEASMIPHAAGHHRGGAVLLRGGSGWGGGAASPATAAADDVLFTRASVLCVLTAQELAGAAVGPALERLQGVTAAARALDRSPSLALLSPSEKARWLAAGTAHSYATGEVILAAGSDDRSMGLVVTGSADVWRAGNLVARLVEGDAFSERSFCVSSGRRARIAATAPTLIWQWRPEWVERELDRCGARKWLVSAMQDRTAWPFSPAESPR